MSWQADSKTIGRYMTNSTHAYYERIVIEVGAASAAIPGDLSYRVIIAKKISVAANDILKQEINDSDHLRVSA
jgi:hypothetical protein